MTTAIDLPASQWHLSQCTSCKPAREPVLCYCCHRLAVAATARSGAGVRGHRKPANSTKIFTCNAVSISTSSSALPREPRIVWISHMPRLPFAIALTRPACKSSWLQLFSAMMPCPCDLDLSRQRLHQSKVRSHHLHGHSLSGCSEECCAGSLHFNIAGTCSFTTSYYDHEGMIIVLPPMVGSSPVAEADSCRRAPNSTVYASHSCCKQYHKACVADYYRHQRYYDSYITVDVYS